jgi:protein-S-isoprenylcysteine O-methyltransferase Ste14
MSHRKGLGAEHPLNDDGQIMFLVVYLVVWALDSFVFRFSTWFAGLVPIFVRLPLGIFSFILGGYIVGKSGRVVFAKADGKPKLITTGVYSWVRHPMYLGSLVVLLSFFLATLSLLSILVWIGLFIFLDRMASYEERDLKRILGEQYVAYQKQVRKWLPI